MLYPKNTWLYIALAGLVALVLIGGAWYWHDINLEISSSAWLGSKINTKKEIKSAEEWPIYLNLELSNIFLSEEYGFQINYPKYFIEYRVALEEKSDNEIEMIKHFWKWDDKKVEDYIKHEITRIADNSWSVDIKKYTIKDLEEKIIKGSIDDMELQNKNGVQYYTINHPSDEYTLLYAFRSMYNDNLFIIIQSSIYDRKIVEDMMLPTFKFIEPK